MKCLNPLFFPLSLLLSLAACGGQSTGEVATIDVARISAYWPKFINYQNQLMANQATSGLLGAGGKAVGSMMGGA